MDPKDSKLFEEDDQQDDLIVAVQNQPQEEPIDEEAPAAKRFLTRELLEDLADKWQIPLLLLFTLITLFIFWFALGRDEAVRLVGVDLKDRSSKKKYGTESFKHFDKVRKESAKTLLKIDQLPDPSGVAASLLASDFIENYDTTALATEHKFLISRMGDTYSQIVRNRLSKDDQEVATGEVLESMRWLKTNLEDQESLRPSKDLHADLTVFYEEHGDRTKDKEQYKNALFHLDGWNQDDSSAPRYHHLARLHTKIDEDENIRAAREYIDASLRSTHPQEVQNRFDVKTLYGKILAKDGQVKEAEKVFSDLMGSAVTPSIQADTAFRLGEMRQILATQALDDGQSPFGWYEKAEQAFNQSLDLYQKSGDTSEDAILKQEVARFHIGSIWMNRGTLDNAYRNELIESRDMFNRLSRRNQLDLPFLHAINVRRAQVATALDRGQEAEETVEEIMQQHEERYWDRTKLVSPMEVVHLIQNLAEVHERNKKFKNQIDVLNHLDDFLSDTDKNGRMRNAIAVARAWIMDAEVNPGPEARVSHRGAARTYLNLLDEPRLRFQKQERLDLLWSAYIQYRECFDQDNLVLWGITLAQKDKESAVDVLDQIISVGTSPRTNPLLNQAYYLKGLLQEEMFHIPEAIHTHELNINTQNFGGDNIYVYLSYLQRARARVAIGSTDDLARAIKDCEELFSREQISPEAIPWQEARFLHGKLNMRLALRSEPNSEAQVSYLKEAVRSLNEAIDRYPDSPQILEAHVDVGLAKIKLSKVDPVHAIDYMKDALADFSIAEQIANSQTLDSRGYHLKKIAMMNLGLTQFELEGDHLTPAAKTFDRLARTFRRDRVEPWALIQRHRVYRRLAQVTRNTARQSNDPELQRQIKNYLSESKRSAEKAVGSWEQIMKLSEQPLKKDFPLDYWQENDHWLLGLEEVIDTMRKRAEES